MCSGLTQVLDVLIANDLESTALSFAGTSTSAEALKDDDTVCGSGGNEGSAVREDGPLGVCVEGQVRKSVADRRQQEGDMASEPCELQCLHELEHALLKREVCSRRGSHCCGRA
jgi:hypothetical protein